MIMFLFISAVLLMKIKAVFYWLSCFVAILLNYNLLQCYAFEDFNLFNILSQLEIIFNN